MLRRVVIAAAFILGAASADAADSVSIWTSSDLKNVTSKLASDEAAKNIAGVTLGTFGSQSCAVWRRTASGEAELHKVKIDLLIIQEGSATLIVGGTIPDARTSGPNEVRGASITGGQSRSVSAGDIIRIPPGTPHQFKLSKGQSVTYFAFKTESGRSATMQ